MPQPPLIFNRLGSDTQLTNSVVGADGTETGTLTYNAAKFGNGAYSNNAANYFSLDASGFDPNVYTIECWIQTDWSMTDGIPGDAAVHRMFCWYFSGVNLTTFGTSATDLFFNHYVSGNNIVGFTTNITWAASTNTHLALVFDRTGIAGGE